MSYKKQRILCVILILLVFGTISVVLIHSYGISYYYQKKIERIFHQDIFPNNRPRGYFKIMHGGSFKRKYIRQAIHALENNHYQDRWGNFPIIYSTIDHLIIYPDDMPTLLSFINDPILSERSKLKAQDHLVKMICDKAEYALTHSYETPVTLSDACIKLLLQIAQSDDYDMMEMRCNAIRALGATGVEEAIPILLSNTDSDPARLRNAAYNGLINIARFNDCGSRNDVQEKLLSLLKTSELHLLLSFLDSLISQNNKSQVSVNSNDILSLFDDVNNDKVIQYALRWLFENDEQNSVRKALPLAQSGSPDIRRQCKNFLEHTDYLSPEQLWPLAFNDSIEVRFMTLQVAFKQNAYGNKSGQYRDILLELEKDSNEDIATIASMYLERFIGKSKNKEFLEAKNLEAKLYKEIFDPPKSSSSNLAVPVKDWNEILNERREIIKQAHEYFPQQIIPGSNVDIYQMLIDEFAKSQDPLVIVVPRQTDIGGLVTSNQNHIILSKEQNITLQEDFGFGLFGPVLYLSEIFINNDNSEAWIEVTTYQGPLSAQGYGVILKKRGGKWNIFSQKPLWIS